MKGPHALAALLIVGVLAVGMSAEAQGLVLSTDGPGNLLAAGAPSVVHIANAPGECVWRVTDIEGAQAAAGTATPTAGKAEVKLPALPHGYYEFIAQCGEMKGKLCLGVVTDHSRQNPVAGPLNVDAAAAWLTKPEQFDTVAKMLRMMGIGWVRERFSWGGVEPEKGKTEPRQYPAIAAAYTKKGVRVYQIFHDSPGWTHAGNDKTRNPADLRDAYAFARRLAEQYRGQVHAWEVWNEPDIGFWPDLSDTYAGLLKAAYLGFKSVDPELPVLCGSMCIGASAFGENLLAAGAADYFDIFNWHIYAPPGAYAGTLLAHLNMLSPHGAAGRPVWLTEAGIPLRATEPDGELSAEDERRQAEYVPRSFASSLAAGTDRHFFFVFPYYLENGVQFGATHRDLSPRPVCVAIAAAVDLLGEGRYLGRLPLPDAPNLTALAFRNGPERVLVVWSGKPQEVKVEVAAPKVTVADLYGRRREVATPGGLLALQIGPAAQYVLGVGEAVAGRLSGTVRPPGKLPENRPCPVIVRGQLQTQSLDKEHDSYLVGAEPCQYAVEAYNFSAQAASGTVGLEAPAGWKVEPAEAPVKLDPMGRATTRFTLTPGKATSEILKISVMPRFAGLNVAPSVSRVHFDFSRIPPTASEELKLNGAEAWAPNISGNGHMEITAADDGVRFDIHFATAGDRWYYPRVVFDPPRDFSAWQGLSFEYRCNAAADKSTVRLQLYESGGAAYLCDALPSAAEWRSVNVRFADLRWGSFSPPDPNGKFDPAPIGTLMIGGNTTEDNVWLQIRNIRLVRW